MADPFISTPVMADKAQSPLEGHATPGTYGNDSDGISIELVERFGMAICEVTAWPGAEPEVISAIHKIAKLKVADNADAMSETAAAFQHAPGRWTVISQDQSIPEKLTVALGDNGVCVDLSHGRTIIRCQGPKVEWVLAKLFAIDFAVSAFPIAKGLATSHHEIFAQIARIDDEAFDVMVFRSYARSFFHALSKASAEVGYEVA